MQKKAPAPSTALVKATDEAALIPLTKENIVKLINSHASPQEVALFLNQCAMFGLNPFKREIYLIKYDPKDKAAFVVGYESYLKRADRTPKWGGMESGTVDDPKTGKPVKAWAKIFRKDWPQPLYHEVYFEEYVQYAKGRDGKPYVTKFWREKPRTMLKKVAICQAMRMAFPDELGGMPYAAEEMPVDHASLPKAEVVTEPEKKAKPLARVRDEFDPEAPIHASSMVHPAGSVAEDVADQADEAGEDIAGMADHELTDDEKKRHQANVGAIKMVLEGQTIDYKDFKKFLLDLQRKNPGGRTFVREKFGHPSLEEGNPKDVAELLKNMNVMLEKYIAKKLKGEKGRAKSKKS